MTSQEDNPIHKASQSIIWNASGCPPVLANTQKMSPGMGVQNQPI